MAYTGSKAFQGIGAQLSIGAAASTTYPTGVTGSTTSGSTAVTVSSGTGITAGMGVSGAGIATGTTVASITGTSLVLSVAATATGTGVALTFTGAFTPIFELTNQPFKPAEWDKLEVSNFNSLNYAKEFIKGMIDSGTVPIEGNYVFGDPGQIALAAAFADRANAYAFQLTLPKQAGQTTSGDTFTFNALVMQFTRLGDLDPKKVVMVKGELQITGGIAYAAGS